MTFGGFLPPHSRGFQGAEGFNTPEGGPKFSIEALTGMRAWRVNQDGSLISPVYTGFVWGAGDNVAVHGDGTANPWARPPVGHDECPTRECSAGFYAYHSEDYWFANDGSTGSYAAHFPWVSGLIAGWGRLVNGPKGFRCGKATIVALCLPVQKPRAWEELSVVREWGSWEAWVEYAVDQIHVKYPRVPTFTTVEDMLARIPLTGGRAA